MKEQLDRKDFLSCFFTNILIHGIDQFVIEHINNSLHIMNPFLSKWTHRYNYIRFIDSFIIFSPVDVKKGYKSCLQSLLKVGFALIIEEPKVQHTRKKFSFISKSTVKKIIFPGFDIFGFYFQHCRFQKLLQYKEDFRITREKNAADVIYQIIITPSKKRIAQHFNNLSYAIFIADFGIYFQSVIKKVNTIIWSWCNYFRYYNCQNRFRLRQYTTFYILKQWNKKSEKKYFCKMRKKISNQSRIAAYLNLITIKTTSKILLHIDFTPKTFVQVKREISIFDQDNLHWNKRFSKIENIRNDFTEFLRLFLYLFILSI